MSVDTIVQNENDVLSITAAKMRATLRWTASLFGGT